MASLPQTPIDLSPELAAFAQAPTHAHFAIDFTPDPESGIDWSDVRVTLRAEDTTLTAEPLIAEGHKVLVFSQFVRMLDLIRIELTARGIPHPPAHRANGKPAKFGRSISRRS